MKIAIAGPGRSGTSLLVKILRGWGFSSPDTHWFDQPQAGLEVRIGAGGNAEIEKDPWAYEYIHSVDLKRYDAFIIPIRNRKQAVSSRIVQERFFRAVGADDDSWSWNSTGSAPGGAVSDISEKGISQVLAEGLWDLLTVLAEKEVQPIFISFPRFAVDFDYLWAQLAPIARKRTSKKGALRAWREIVKPDLLESSSLSENTLEVQALMELVEKLRKEIRKSQQEGI